MKHAQYLNHLLLCPNQHNLQPMSIHIDSIHWVSEDYGNIIFGEPETRRGGQASHVKAKPTGRALVTKTSDSVGWIPPSWLKQWYPSTGAPGISDSFHFIKVHTEHCVNLPAEQISRLVGDNKTYNRKTPSMLSLTPTPRREARSEKTNWKLYLRMSEET